MTIFRWENFSGRSAYSLHSAHHFGLVIEDLPHPDKRLRGEGVAGAAERHPCRKCSRLLGGCGALGRADEKEDIHRMKFMGGFFLSSSRVVILQGHVLFICFRGRRLPEGFVDPSYVEDALLLWDSEARRDGRRCTLRVSGRTFRLTFADEQVASRWVEMLRKASGSHSFQEKAMSQIVSLLQLAREATWIEHRPGRTQLRFAWALLSTGGHCALGLHCTEAT
ncbi:unnamed protein product [Durusdinium trenchii]|uniref:PH domain-containing protein n=1 Tax=Durusdinium trenchii TaxID=1381693 RepID=A0ABP0QAX9_9DINO